ncbi:MAG: LysM peptidoglycan-binding domain-containing protein, partial [Rhodospirillaceae bacterium]|nr:LysM peptidoglycan-binding domain-containing protein [Rhodospirillaceae bacterium]
MRARSIRQGACAAVLPAVLVLSACNMGGRPEPGTPEVAAVPPATAPAGPVVEAPVAAPSPGTIEYYAMPGETVAGVAARFGVDAQSVIDANGLTPPYQLSAGQRLTIPPPREHVVVAGDTVYSIAKRYGVSREELVRLNGIPPSYNIRIGQRLVLPARPAALSAAPQAAVTATDATAAAAPPAAPSGPPIALQPAPAPSAPASHRGIAAVELPPPAKPVT